jgi:23S rRNA (pseudouridine1915-N3)-methyltransferase
LRLHIAAIGKLKTGPEKMLANDYAGRIEVFGRKAGITSLKIGEWPESQNPNVKTRMEEEAKILWSAVPSSTITFVLDERGKSHSSEEFAALIRKHADQGANDLSFLLGGPDGHDATTRTKANHIIALGAMTWPHRLARIMLLEQIYRSLTIMMNHPYHRS